MATMTISNRTAEDRRQASLDRSRTKSLLVQAEQAVRKEKLNNLRSELGARIRAEFPSVPKGRLKEMIDYYSDPDFRSPHRDEQGLHGEWRQKIQNLVRAWVRHRLTDYDLILASAGVGGAQNKKAARLAVQADTRATTRAWQRKV